MAINKAEILQKADKLLALPFVSGEFPIPVEKNIEHLGFEYHLCFFGASTSAIAIRADSLGLD